MKCSFVWKNKIGERRTVALPNRARASHSGLPAPDRLANRSTVRRNRANDLRLGLPNRRRKYFCRRTAIRGGGIRQPLGPFPRLREMPVGILALADAEPV